MTHDDEAAGPAPDAGPWQQLLLDDIFLLMTLGLVVPTLFYIVWGLMELANVRVFVP